MQIDEAIEFLSRYLDNEHYTNKCNKAHQIAISALEKQMPKKPVIKFGEKPVTHNYGRLMQFFCPGCGRHIIAMYETDVLRGGGISNDVKGCYSCLQRIDFSGYYHKGGEDNERR